MISRMESESGDKARRTKELEHSFYHELQKLSWDQIADRVYNMRPVDVERAIQHAGHCSPEEFEALISPAAVPYLELIAQESQRLTRRRFGRVLSLYVPLYLSNACTNSCVYCGYSRLNRIPRKTLTADEVRAEAQSIRALGFEHILLLTGEATKDSGFEYLREMVRILRPMFPQISIEVQPMGVDEYAALGQEGLHSVYVYQETYNEAMYPEYHLAGMKRNFRYRLETPDRIGMAGIHRIGLGALLGLEDWRVETVCVAHHLRYLQRMYWKSKYTVSFPRLRPHAGQFQPKFEVKDRDLLQIIMAYRLLDENLEMSLTTRESAYFRDHAFPLGITSLSAGSHTEPGGYAQPNSELEQFRISDDRSPAQVQALLHQHGYEAVWKDWDWALQ